MGLDDFRLLVGPAPGAVLGPGERADLTVGFLPQASAVTYGKILIEHDGVLGRELELIGFGGYADLVLTPPETFFLWVTEGCVSDVHPIRVTNVGAVAGRIDGARFGPSSDPSFEVVTPLAPGTLIPAGAQLEFGARMIGQPGALGSAYGDLLLDSTGTLRPVARVGLFGITESLADAARVDVFRQGGGQAVDVLFVVDNSGSMGWAQASMAANFSAFISYFATEVDIDYQLGITSTDVTPNAVGGGPGYLVGPVLTRDTPNLEAEFVSQVQVGTVGSGYENGLKAAALAVTEPAILGPNAGFLRPNALLAIIWVSDEEDDSPGRVSDYINIYLDTKNYLPGQVIGYAIAGDVPNSCGQAWEAGARYLAAATGLEGEFFSICDPDWAAKLSDIAWGIGQRLTEFALSRPPDPNSITVLVTYPDGTVQEVPRYDPNGSPPEYNGWSLDPDTNAITFHGNAVPDNDSRIEVSYNTRCLEP